MEIVSWYLVQLQTIVCLKVKILQISNFFDIELFLLTKYELYKLTYLKQI